MSETVERICRAHGGVKAWEETDRISCKASIHGMLFTLRQQPDIFRDVHIEVKCHSPETTYWPCPDKNQRGVYQPDKVSIFEGTSLLSERLHPRESFEGRPRKQPWDQLDAIYFGGYAIWHYLTAPFLFTHSGVEVWNGEPWTEGGNTWSRLHVRFPEKVHTNCQEQVYYFDETGLLQRMDYHVEIVDSAIKVAHYMYDYVKIGKLAFPTRRCAYPRNSRGIHDPNVTLVELNLTEYETHPVL